MISFIEPACKAKRSLVHGGNNSENHAKTADRFDHIANRSEESRTRTGHAVATMYRIAANCLRGDLCEECEQLYGRKRQCSATVAQALELSGGEMLASLAWSQPRKFIRIDKDKALLTCEDGSTVRLAKLPADCWVDRAAQGAVA